MIHGVCMVCSIYVACSTYWQQPWQLIIAAVHFQALRPQLFNGRTRLGRARQMMATEKKENTKTQILVKIKRANDRSEKSSLVKKHNIFVRQRQYWHEKLKEAKEVLV